MANNPSYGKYRSESTIFEDMVGAQFGTLPKYIQPPKEPKPATFSSYSAPVELNPFVNIEMRVAPPRDATQEALNEWGRRGYLSRGLIADSRVREQEILQQTVESKVNSIVNDEFDRRRAVRRGVYESTGMTPAEIDEKFASDVLAQRENAVQRATTDGQVRDALIRYFTIRGGIVPAYLNPPPVVAPAVNNEAGINPALAGGLPPVDGDNVEQPDPFAGLVDFGGAAEPPIPPPAVVRDPLAGAGGGLSPSEWVDIMDLRSFDGGVSGQLPRGSTLYKDQLARFLVQVGQNGASGRPLTVSSWKQQSLAELVRITFNWLREHPAVNHPDDLGGGALSSPTAFERANAGKGGVPSPAGSGGGGAAGGGAAFLPPRDGAEVGGSNVFDDIFGTKGL